VGDGTLEYLIGGAVGLLSSLFGTVTRFDRERVFYPVVLVVVAAYYLLFAAIGGSPAAWPGELAGAAVFIVLAVLGYRVSLWIAAAGLVGHGLFDLVHPLIINDPGVPKWWPAFCFSADIPLGAYLAWRLSRFSVKPPLPARPHA